MQGAKRQAQKYAKVKPIEVVFSISLGIGVS
jgi:hypothetical protein